MASCKYLGVQSLSPCSTKYLRPAAHGALNARQAAHGA